MVIVGNLDQESFMTRRRSKEISLMYEVGGHDVETPKKVNLGELDAL
jgi:hypothetical protein